MIRKLCIGGIGGVLCLLWGPSGFGLEPFAPRGELRIVDTSPLNWLSIALNVFERLIEIDIDGNLDPGLATGWRWIDDRTLEVTLRQGVVFHNGEAFDAETVRLNWEAYAGLRQPQMMGEFMNFKPGSRLEVVDPSTVRFRFPEPDGAALVKLGRLHMANRQFHEEHGWGEQQWGMLNKAGPWGTGPYRLMDGFSSSQKRSDRIVLEASRQYWAAKQSPRPQRLVFDNTLSRQEALQSINTAEGPVDLVSELRPVEAMSVAQSSFAEQATKRAALVTVFGQLNMRKAGSPWRDVRLRQAINLAVNRQELLGDIKGHGVIIPALAPEGAFGYDAAVTPYPFDPDKARQILQEAGYPDALMLELIAPEELQTQAISISMMLEQVGFTVDLQVLDAGAFQRQTRLKDVDHPPEQRTWDVALRSALDHLNFPPFLLYHDFALDGPSDWVGEEPELRRLYEEILRTVDREQQERLIRQMERHAHEQASFLYLYNPAQLYAVNKAVTFVLHATTLLPLVETSVTDAHWSVRKISGQEGASETRSAQADWNNAEQVALGEKVYVSFCAGCHGANLEGQPDWQKRLPLGNFPAPPHDETGHTWHHPDQWLFDIVKDGGQRFAPPRYRSAMPAYRDMLTDEEIWAVLAFIKSRWPSSIRAEQARVDARGQ